MKWGNIENPLWRWQRKWIKLEQKSQKAKEEEALRNVVRKQKYVLYPILMYVNKNYEKETYFIFVESSLNMKHRVNNVLHIISLHFDVCKIIFKS
jgi:hypothetical protein